MLNKKTTFAALIADVALVAASAAHTTIHAAENDAGIKPQNASKPSKTGRASMVAKRQINGLKKRIRENTSISRRDIRATDADGDRKVIREELIASKRRFRSLTAAVTASCP